MSSGVKSRSAQRYRYQNLTATSSNRSEKTTSQRPCQTIMAPKRRTKISSRTVDLFPDYIGSRDNAQHLSIRHKNSMPFFMAFDVFDALGLDCVPRVAKSYISTIHKQSRDALKHFEGPNPYEGTFPTAVQVQLATYFLEADWPRQWNLAHRILCHHSRSTWNPFTDPGSRASYRPRPDFNKLLVGTHNRAPTPSYGPYPREPGPTPFYPNRPPVWTFDDLRARANVGSIIVGDVDNPTKTGKEVVDADVSFDPNDGRPRITFQRRQIETDMEGREYPGRLRHFRFNRIVAKANINLYGPFAELGPRGGKATGRLTQRVLAEMTQDYPQISR